MDCRRWCLDFRAIKFKHSNINAINTCPKLLGQGVNLFNDMTDQVQLNLKDVTQYNQFVELSYDVQYD